MNAIWPAAIWYVSHTWFQGLGDGIGLLKQPAKIINRRENENLGVVLELK